MQANKLDTLAEIVDPKNNSNLSKSQVCKVAISVVANADGTTANIQNWKAIFIPFKRRILELSKT